jgi:hypothetical protein
MQAFFSIEKKVYRFYVSGIGDTTINGTNGGALGFFVETGAFRAFIGNDEIDFIAYGFEHIIGSDYGAVFHGKSTCYSSSLGYRPLHTCLINGIIGTFGFACATIYTFFCDDNCHNLSQSYNAFVFSPQYIIN